ARLIQDSERVAVNAQASFHSCVIGFIGIRNILVNNRFCPGEASGKSHRRGGRNSRGARADGTRIPVPESGSESLFDAAFEGYAEPGGSETGCRGTAVHEDLPGARLCFVRRRQERRENRRSPCLRVHAERRTLYLKQGACAD